MAGCRDDSRPAAGLPPHIRALIYDFDDTIVESERINDVMFGRLLSERYGIELTGSDVEMLYGLSWTGVFDWLRANKGLLPTRAEVWARFLEIKAEYLSRQKLRTARGIDRMLALPVIHAIVSGSTRPELSMMMENIGLSTAPFSFILCDEDCPRGKPDPDPFLQALRRLDIPAGEVLVFEDSVPGLQAARAAGIPAAYMAELASGHGASVADICFATFEDAWDVVKERVGEGLRS
jgi:beta-phosphoglucomutase-like phosphatase (HAD superfamily)